MTAAVDVVLVAYNSVGRLEQLLPLLKSEPTVGAVVVVDHGADGSGPAARAFGAFVAEDPSNPGFGAGQNRGVSMTTSPYVALMNPDLVPDEGVLGRGAEFLEAHPRVAAVQGLIVSESGGAPERSAGRSLGPVHLWGRVLRLRGLLRIPLVGAIARRSSALRDHVDRVAPGPRQVEALAATMILVRRQAFDEVGGFDPSYFLYGEDLDLCRRLRAAGWELWTLPVPWATHASGESSGDRWSRELVWWEGTMRFAARWWNGPGFASGLTASALRTALLALRRPSRATEAWRRLVRAPLSEREGR